MPKYCRTDNQGSEIRPNFDQNCPSLAEVGHCWRSSAKDVTKFDQLWTSLAKFVTKLPNASKIPRDWSMCCRFGSNSAKTLSQVRRSVGQSWSKFGQRRPDLAPSAEFGPNLGCWHTTYNVGATFGNCWTTCGRLRSSPKSLGVNCGDTQRAQFPQHSDTSSLSAIIGLYKAADITSIVPQHGVYGTFMIFPVRSSFRSDTVHVRLKCRLLMFRSHAAAFSLAFGRVWAR